MEPFLELEKEFELRHPDIDVQPEGHGSIQVIRYMTDLGKEADIAAVADEQLIPLMMYRAQLPDGKGPYADWYVRFADNRVCLAYRPDSAYASEINVDNWYDILARTDVRIAMSNPLIDSLGYRILMLVYLAGVYYDDGTMFRKIITDNFSGGLEVDENNGIATIKVPELLKPTQDRIYMRNYSIQTLALLEAGEVDYAFEYESVARQRGLNFLSLPREIDLSSREYADRYSGVSVKLDFQRFASVLPDFVGAPVVYGITIPLNAPHPKEALKFIEFLFGPDGQHILSENFQPALSPVTVDGENNLPDELRPYLN
jgi:molybdate/tungstate transport system substrate-binding protein